MIFFRPFILAGAILIVCIIYLKNYLKVEKKIDFSGSKSKKKLLYNPFRHKNSQPSLIEVTTQELVAERKETDSKKIAKALELVKKADIYLENQKIQEAEKKLIEAISLDPDCLEAYRRLGTIYVNQHQFGKGETIYRKLAVNIPDDAVIYSNLALCLFQQQQLPEAKLYYKKAIEIDPERPGRFFSLGQVLYQLEEYEEAREYLEKAVAMDLENLDYLLTLAHFYINQELKEEAQALLKHIIAKFPDNEEAKKALESL